MARMIPDTPHDFDPASQEGLMFDALKNLSDDYYVFHSFRITTVQDNVFHESEADFIIFNRKYGVLVLEAKAGMVKYENGYWYYANGEPIKHGGPFNQASSNKYKLLKYIEKSRLASIKSRCKFIHGVWFPSVSDDALKTMPLPSEADRNLIMTKEALIDPQKYIERIFQIQLTSSVQTNLSEMDEKLLVREIFCPQFNIFPSVSSNDDLKKIVFHKLLIEQANILNFLTEQKSAIINGVAGTGKTMIAVEKAKRHANQGEKVLFLCYNNQLKNYLSENYENDFISYYTISGLACKMCNTSIADYQKFEKVLEDMYLMESFPYKHIIIDEGQDFGIDVVEEADIINQLRDIITDRNGVNGTFYVFYDKLQLVQAKVMPKFIEDADCKLTLYRNCRNTENIATTSLRPINERKPILLEGCIKGTPAKVHFCKTNEDAVISIDNAINGLKADGYKDIVILTCKTEEKSILSNKCKNVVYRNKYKFTTCRKFKGLEADAIILIDVGTETFNKENVLLFYVGTSRARLKLDIVTTVDNDDCVNILKNYLGYKGKIRNPKKDFVAELNATGTMK